MRSDEELLAEVLARNPRAWRELVRTHEPGLRAVVRDTAPEERPISDAEIDDVLGDFWLLLLEDDLRRLRGFQKCAGSQLADWLALVVSEVTRKELRRRERLPEMVVYDDTVENRIAAAVIRELGERGIVGRHDHAVPSPGTTQEGICPDDATNEIGSSARHGYRAERAGESSSSRRQQRTRRRDELLDTIAKRMRRTMQQ